MEASRRPPDHLPIPCERQADGEDCPSAHLALHKDLAAMSLDNPEAHGQPEPCSLAGALRGEEGAEDMRQDMGRDAASGVHDVDGADAGATRVRIAISPPPLIACTAFRVR